MGGMVVYILRAQPASTKNVNPMTSIHKQNASLEKSPTKKVKTQCNHVYAAMIAYCKLEMLKFKTGLNHFAIKYKLIVRANQIAMQELKNMAC